MTRTEKLSRFWRDRLGRAEAFLATARVTFLAGETERGLGLIRKARAELTARPSELPDDPEGEEWTSFRTTLRRLRRLATDVTIIPEDSLSEFLEAADEVRSAASFVRPRESDDDE